MGSNTVRRAQALVHCLDAFAVNSTTVTSIHALLQRLNDQSPDVILLDAGVLTDGGGEQVLESIAQRCVPTPPRLLVTVSLGMQIFESNLYHATLLKPVRRTELFNLLSGDTAHCVATGPQDKQIPTPAPAIAGRVLLVDDNPMNLQVASAMLQRMGITVDTASGGHKALTMLDDEAYRLILMDEQMPEMDGLETTRQIRSRCDDHQQVPIIALTANADSVAEKRCLNAGMNGFLTKPVRRRQLRSVLSQWLPELLDRAGPTEIQ